MVTDQFMPRTVSMKNIRSKFGGLGAESTPLWCPHILVAQVTVAVFIFASVTLALQWIYTAPDPYDSDLSVDAFSEDR